jgi:hypothetical protein
MLIFGSDLSGVNKVQVWAYDLTANTSTQVSPNTKNWNEGSGRHYGVVVNDIFYGGGAQDKMYSWDPTGGWKNNVGDVSPAPDAFVTDQAYRRRDRVTYSSKVYSALTDFQVDEDSGLRVEKWQNVTGTTYTRGNEVLWKAGGTYYKRFTCVRTHTMVGNPTSTVEPGVGALWKSYWRVENTTAPLDDDGKTVDDWKEVITAPTTDVAVWHADRLFARDDTVSKDRLISSRQAQLDDVAIGNVWDPSDWRTTLRKDSAAVIPITTQEGDPITALWDFDNYLIIFKKRSTFVLSGYSPLSWTKRKLSDYGALGKRAVAELNGKVYFVSDQGMHFTDGTMVDEVPGAEAIRDWLRDATNWDAAPANVTMWAYKNLLWISLPTGGSGLPSKTLVYDPLSQSFWPQDLQVQAVALSPVSGVEQMYFSPPTRVGTPGTAAYAWAGTANISQSTRTIGGVVERNGFVDPDFEYNPNAAIFGDTAALQYWTIANNSGVDVTKVKRTKTKAAARHKKHGLEIQNLQDSLYGGVAQQASDFSTGSHTIAFAVRRKFNSDKQKPKVQLWVGTSLYTPTFKDIGDGWWRVSASYIGSLTPRPHGILTAPNTAVYIDQALMVEGALAPWFDGNGGDNVDDGVTGGESGILNIYDGVTQDNGVDIPWFMQSAWFPFATSREDRQIRRVWGTVRGEDIPVGLRLYRNFATTLSTEVIRQMTHEFPASYVEGVYIPDSYAVSIGLEGKQAPATILGISVDTRYRRARYHRP